MFEVFGGYAVTPRGMEKDYSVIVEGDRIMDCGPTRKMRTKYGFMDSIGSSDLTISPSFIDAHTHSFQYPAKNLKASLLEWLKRVWKIESEITSEQARAFAEASYLEMIRSGVSTFVDYTASRHADQAFLAARKLGLRAFIGKTVMDRNAPHAESTDSCLRETESLIRKFHLKENRRLNYSVTPRFGITCTDDLLRGCISLSRKYRTILTTHANESTNEMKQDRKNYGKSAIMHYRDIGLLGRNTLLVHCVHTTQGEIRAIKESGSAVVHCPGSNLALGSGIADTPGMVRAGIPVALGSDVGAYWNFNLYDQMKLARLIQKKPVDSLGFATNASALGLMSGKLARGHLADIVLLKNCYDPDSIVFNSEPDTLICDGRIIMKNGKVKGERKIVEKLHEFL